jgi:hypothetical protein
VYAPATAGAEAVPADRPAAGDTGAEAGSDRQQEPATWAPALAAPRTDIGALAPAASGSEPAQAARALPPAAQVALKLAPLRTGPDGTHQLTIHLNPENLGPISVIAQVRGDELSVQLTGGTEAGRDALKAALPELERELRDGGFNTIAVNVRAPAPVDAAQRPAWAGGPPGTGRSATDNATSGTGTTTLPAKTESQPIGQVDRPDGVGTRHPARPDNLGTGMYNATGQAVPGTAQAGTGQPAGQQHTGQHQPGNQLNLGQPGGNQPDQSGRYGTTDQQHTGGQHGTGREGGTGRPEGGERDQRDADHRPTTDRAVTRSVDLRV